MTRKQAQKRLENCGFVFDTEIPNGDRECLYGTKSPEHAVDVGRDTFIPDYRSAFVSARMAGSGPAGFYYVTSHIIGTYHKYRSRACHDMKTKFDNIYGSGRTLKQAVEVFIHNLEYSIYHHHD